MKPNGFIQLLLGIILMIALSGAVPADELKNIERQKVDINCANVEKLCSVPEIDRDMANRIVEYRKVNGVFKSNRNLLSVPGITPDILKKLIPWLFEIPSNICTIPESDDENQEWEEAPVLNISNC